MIISRYMPVEHLSVPPFTLFSLYYVTYCLPFSLILSIHHFQSSGKLDSFIEKKRKRNAAKDRKFMPYARSGENVE
jgi:hypothetical protein